MTSIVPGVNRGSKRPFPDISTTSFGGTSANNGPSTSFTSARSRSSNGDGLRAPINCNMVSLMGPAVLQEAIVKYKSKTGLTRDDYVHLDWVFGPLIQSAFEIIDKQNAAEESTNFAVAPTSTAAPRTPSNVLERPIVIFQCSKSAPVRVIMRIAGSKENYYWIRMTDDHFTTFTNPKVKLRTNVLAPNTCQCVSYKRRKDMCKHLLAAYFYLGITDKNEFVEIEEDEFDRICEIACAQ